MVDPLETENVFRLEHSFNAWMRLPLLDNIKGPKMPSARPSPSVVSDVIYGGGRPSSQLVDDLVS